MSGEDVQAPGPVEDPDWPRASAWLAGDTPQPPPHAPVLAILGVPLSQASISPSQAHLTPRAVRAALRRFSTFAVLPGGETARLEDIRLLDLGDLDLEELPNSIAQDVVAEAVGELAVVEGIPDTPDLLILVGGDNALTRPALRARAGDLGRAGLLTLDAHHDVRGFHAGPTNGTPVRGLIEDGLPGRNIVQIGVGSFTNSRAHRAWAEEQGITVIGALDARREGVGALVTEALNDLASGCDLLWVDLDVDVLDRAYAPGAPGARPGGLAPAELHAAALAAGRHPTVYGIDIVEVDAGADPTGITVDNAALCLLHAAAGLSLRGRSRGADRVPPRYGAENGVDGLRK
jgi:formiminoglutamase